MQVRQGDQPWYPEDTIESFVGHSSMGFLCPPAEKFNIENSKTGSYMLFGTECDSHMTARWPVLETFWICERRKYIYNRRLPAAHHGAQVHLN